VKEQASRSAGRRVDDQITRRDRPQATNRSGQVKPALLFFFSFIDFIASGSIETDDERCSPDSRRLWVR